MQSILRLAQRGYGRLRRTKRSERCIHRGKVIKRGWHHRAGLPHAEIEALRDAHAKGHDAKGATLFVTLDHPVAPLGGRRPARMRLSRAGIRKVRSWRRPIRTREHSGKAFRIVEASGD